MISYFSQEQEKLFAQITALKSELSETEMREENCELLRSQLNEMGVLLDRLSKRVYQFQLMVKERMES